jgi:DNA-binding GntR family transcriptional regulator
VTRKRDPFVQSLEHLRQLSEQGAFAPGTPIVIVEEARRLRLSTTPAREALAWLCGEGLIERAPCGGYVAPRMEAAVVCDRYALRLHCLTTSLEQAAARRDRDEPLRSDASAQDQLDEHLSRLVRGGGDMALAEAFERVGRQLRPLAEAERRIFHDREDEAAALLRLSHDPSMADLREGLVAYHQRRIEAAALLVLDVSTGPARDVGEAD